MTQQLTYLITGASRGLGFGYAKGLLASSPSIKIVAAARNPSSAEQLQALSKENDGRVYVLQLDVNSEESIKNAVEELEGSGFVDKEAGFALVNNAGVCTHRRVSVLDTTPAMVADNIETNLYAVMNLTRALYPLISSVEGAKQIISVDSTCGSITEFGENTHATAYCVSKVALNMWSKKLSVELADKGFTVLTFHPGYVKTDMNHNVDAEITTDEAVAEALKNVFIPLTKPDHGLNGAFLRYSGGQMPW